MTITLVGTPDPEPEPADPVFLVSWGTRTSSSALGWTYTTGATLSMNHYTV